MFVCVRTAPPRGTERGRGRGGVVFLCVRIGGSGTVQPHTPNPQTAYSTASVLPDLRIQSPEENLILHNPPPLIHLIFVLVKL